VPTPRDAGHAGVQGLSKLQAEAATWYRRQTHGCTKYWASITVSLLLFLPPSTVPNVIFIRCKMDPRLAASFFDYSSPGSFMSLDRFWGSIKQRFGQEFSHKQVKDFYLALEKNQTHQLSKRPKLYRHFLFHGLNVKQAFPLVTTLRLFFRETWGWMECLRGLAMEVPTSAVSTWL
jgi:hypothetical protein